MKDDKRHAELDSASMNEIPKHRERRLEAGKLLQWSSLSESPSSFAAKGRDDNNSKYSDILDYDWNYDSLPNRMPLSQRAKIFLPFAALTGFDEAIQKTIDQEIAELGE